MSECIFCKIVKGEIPCNKLYEDEHFLAFLDIMPAMKGHTLLIPKKHCKDITDFPEEEGTNMIRVMKTVANAVKSASESNGVNIGMNNGDAAGQVVMHAHWHIIPRFAGDGLESWPQKKYEDGEIDEIQAKIIKVLEE